MLFCTMTKTDHNIIKKSQFFMHISTWKEFDTVHGIKKFESVRKTCYKPLQSLTAQSIHKKYDCKEFVTNS